MGKIGLKTMALEGMVKGSSMHGQTTVQLMLAHAETSPEARCIVSQVSVSI